MKKAEMLRASISMSRSMDDLERVSHGHVEEDSEDVPLDDITTERKLFLSVMKAEYWSMRHEGMLPDGSEAAQILLDSIDHAETTVKTCLSDWDFIERILCQSKKQGFLRVLSKIVLRKASGHVKFAPIRGPDGASFDCYAFICFIDAHHATIETLACRQTFGEISPARKQVLKESALELRSAEFWFMNLELSEYTESKVRMKQLALKILNMQRNKVMSWLKTGMINSIQAEELLKSTISDLNGLQRQDWDFVTERT